MKKIEFLFIIVVLGTCILISCSNKEEYSLDKHVENIVTVENNDGSKKSYSSAVENNRSFIVGDSTQLLVVADAVPSYTVDSRRAYINYTILDKIPDEDRYYIKLNGIVPVTTKGISWMNPMELEKMPNDPIGIKNITISNGYINVMYYFNYGADPAKHELKLYRTYESGDNQQEIWDKEVIILDLRHNAEKDDERWVKNDMACFDIRSLRKKNINDTLKIKIKINTFEGRKIYDYKYVLKDDASW